jgi:hypothetical protein
MDDSTTVLTIIPYRGIQYSDGIAGGTALKYAVKLPNWFTVSVCCRIISCNIKKVKKGGPVEVTVFLSPSKLCNSVIEYTVETIRVR